MKRWKPWIAVLAALAAGVLLLSGCAPQAVDVPAADTPAQTAALDAADAYTTKEDVALYLHLYGNLPDNFITKSQARELGWSSGGLDAYAPGQCIGGDRFGNYEGLLPEKTGRVFYECDINTLGADGRGPERIVYSNDGLVYYTPDHYETFALLYGDDGV